jgi:hypothetical protein
MVASGVQERKAEGVMPQDCFARSGRVDCIRPSISGVMPWGEMCEPFRLQTTSFGHRRVALAHIGFVALDAPCLALNGEAPTIARQRSTRHGIS